MIDRESYEYLSRHHQQVLNDMAKMEKDGQVVLCSTDYPFLALTHLLNRDLHENAKSAECYVFSNTTTERVTLMNVRDVALNHATFSMLVRNDERGYLICPKFSLNAAYHIDNGHFFLRVYNGIRLAGFCLFNIEDDTGCEFYAFSPITTSLMKIMFKGVPIENEDIFFPSGDPYKSNFKGRYNDIIRHIGDDNRVSSLITKFFYTRTLPKKYDKIPARTKEELKEYVSKIEYINLALAMFTFLKTAQVYDKEYVSDIPGTYARSRGYKKLDYCLVNSTWDMNINVNNPFAVRGHFRHQPKKDENGQWYKDLIYIDGFMKKGYHRRATKIIKKM